MGFNISSDGRYFELDGKIYDSITNLNTDIDNPNPIFICEMYKNLFVHSNDNNLFEIKDLFKKMKTLVHPFFKNNSNIIMEYEVRFGMIPLLESKNSYMSHSIIIENSWDFVKIKLYELYPELINEGLWDWIKEKGTESVKAASKFASDTWSGIKQAGQWILNKGLPWFFKQLEDFLLSPVGIATDVALTAIGVGKIATTILWGALGVWKIYQLISGESKLTGNWKEDIFLYLDIAICFVGMIFSGGAKAVKSGIVAAGKDVAKLGKSSLTYVIRMLGKGLNFISKLILEPMEWLAKTLGGNKVTNMISSVKNSLGKVFKGMEESVSHVAKLETPEMAKSYLKKDIITPVKAAIKTKGAIKSATKKGVQTGLAFHGLNKGIEKGVKAYVDNNQKNQEDVLTNIASDENLMQATISNDLNDALNQMKSSEQQ